MADYYMPQMQMGKYGVNDEYSLVGQHPYSRDHIILPEIMRDNGPHDEGGADPTFFGYNAALRGIKRHTHEGGVRVPFIAWWPGRVADGMVNDHILAFYDTLCPHSAISWA